MINKKCQRIVTFTLKPLKVLHFSNFKISMKSSKQTRLETTRLENVHQP